MPSTDPKGRPVRWTQDLLRERFIPRWQPQPVPSAGIFDAPYGCVRINAAWLSHVLGVLDVLTQLDAWSGTANDIQFAQQEIEKAMHALALGECGLITDIRVNGCVLEVEYDNAGVWVAIGDLGACVVAGEPGPAGPAGADGLTPAPIWDGTSLSWDTDLDGVGDTTWVDLQGPQGLTGATGATGAQGPVGPEGPTGPAGPQGETGECLGPLTDYPPPTSPDNPDQVAEGDGLRCGTAFLLANEVRDKWVAGFDYVDGLSLLSIGSAAVALIAILIPEPSTTVAGMSFFIAFITALLRAEGSIQRDDFDDALRDEIAAFIYCRIDNDGVIPDTVLDDLVDELNTGAFTLRESIATIIAGTPNDVWRARVYTQPNLLEGGCAAFNCGPDGDIVIDFSTLTSPDWTLSFAQATPTTSIVIPYDPQHSTGNPAPGCKVSFISRNGYKGIELHISVNLTEARTVSEVSYDYFYYQPSNNVLARSLSLYDADDNLLNGWSTSANDAPRSTWNTITRTYSQSGVKRVDVSISVVGGSWNTGNVYGWIDNIVIK